jgi:hypothetical protein
VRPFSLEPARVGLIRLGRIVIYHTEESEDSFRQAGYSAKGGSEVRIDNFPCSNVDSPQDHSGYGGDDGGGGEQGGEKAENG